ncbi:specifically androgen-regulated gene protein [Boleophthalmus pectinirostris]|uniref:specifically androgen-regulated gene protein n=1 Tax=Boleophthalmus pectinirostris TaxID=150288 RepID=UPI0024328167|nr:specifically androgen-regulated gene protein [Boleophthalmus pectinirostris]
MPKSDTWPGGTGLEAMPGTDSSGSCDSVLSTNSGFSDDSLEYLSAEEKACLMFLEETIDSLDTEDDSGLSNEETEQKPRPRTVASKQAELTSHFNQSLTKSEEREISTHSVKPNVDKNLPSYLVPTPFVIANSTQSSTAKPSVAPKKNKASNLLCNVSDKEINPKIPQSTAPPPVPLEVNVIIPPKIQQHSGKAVDSSLQRGPLSYDALVYLRKNAAEKKTPLCPSVDHTIESVNQDTTTGSVQSNISRFDRFHPEFSQSRTIPPAVPLKPKKSTDISKTKPQTALGSSHSFSVKRTPNPEIVRQEALQKLGLIKESNEASLPTSTPKVQDGPDSATSEFVTSPAKNNSMRSPSFCVTRLPSEPKSKGLQSSASFHNSSRPDQASGTHNQTNRLKNGPQNNYRNEPHHLVPSEPAKGLNAAQSAAPKTPSAVGYTVMVVPGMGADRREALRKLGLLKD